MAFISHKGPSVHSGHHIRRKEGGGLAAAAAAPQGGEWVLFVKADAESVNDLKQLVYLYFFVRLNVV
jgi:ubiquitin carboxyl-terminal hydrolase 5/13